jgi:hypothetical protein
MRALCWSALILLGSASFVSAYAADAEASFKGQICNVNWNPPCRPFDVSTAIPESPQSAEAQQPRYSFQINRLTKEQLEKVLSLLGADKSKINLNEQ